MNFFPVLQHALAGVANDLHIRADYPIFPNPCVPDLVRVLASKQAGELRSRMQSMSAFGLHLRPSAAEPIVVTDIFLPTAQSFHGVTVYRGLHTDAFIYQCELEQTSETTLAVASTADLSAWGRCEGSVWINMGTSQARTVKTTDANGQSAVTRGVHFGFGMDVCWPMLSTKERRQAVIRIASTNDNEQTIAFADGASSQDIACTLLWSFGAYSAAQLRPRRSIIRLPPSSSVGDIHLVGDVVVPSGYSIKLESAADSNATISVGRRQIRVDQGGSLELVRVRIRDSYASSAMNVEGTMTARNSTFENCSTTATLGTAFQHMLGIVIGCPVP